jgi:hypothetical protein
MAQIYKTNKTNIMTKLKTYSEFVNESKYKEDQDLLEANTIYEEYNLLEEGWLKQMFNYSLFLPLTLLNILRQLLLKKIKVKRMLNKETDPKKQAALRAELKALKYEEVKAKEKVQKAKQKVKIEADSMKSSATPEEKEKYKKQKEQMNKKLVQAQRDYENSKLQFNGLV